ncbi:hypothetical protein CDD81_4430 [Ophiocordyceps australis]|uniref:Uncharacterized protein n=1 Tax=Ophiocordyceps australis TaxID=1399860 RepID=A0A2C5YC03_9HYPO|nr:hypothetical protein CDD81_4430 [Ophiocordyceps australis]
MSFALVVIRRRATLGWSGSMEPNKQGDLLVLLSQDRWVRLQGQVDHLKAVTSGQWLRDQTTVENWVTALATLVIYVAAALASNATYKGKILILALLGGSVGLLGIANSTTKDIAMHGHIIKVHGDRRCYQRRLDLAEELIRETGRNDWALRMGMIINEDISVGVTQLEPVIM